MIEFFLEVRSLDKTGIIEKFVYSLFYALNLFIPNYNGHVVV